MMYKKKIPDLSKSIGLDDVILSEKEGRTNNKEKICFIAGDMPVWDVAWSFDLYNNAKKLGLGTKLKLRDSPFLS